MSDRVQITIDAKENASKAFAQVGSAAGKMADQLEKADNSFADLEKSSQDAGSSFRDLDGEIKQVGIGIGILATGVALAGQSFRDQEVALRTLERGYGDAAVEMEAFAEQIQDTTNFSNDAAIAAANTAATLGRNYGFTFEEIQRVLQISADLAAATGFSLEDATQRVVAALRGEAEAAEQLGLTMNQAAIDSENLTLSMSNQEAGHFRLNALIDQSAFAMGSAAEQADTTYGAMTDLRDGVQDAAQSFGEFLGPVGEIGAFAADNAVQIAAMGLAVGQLGKSASAANTILKNFGVGLGPVGLALAAATAVVAISQFADALGTEFHQASEESIATIDELIAKVVELGDTTALGTYVVGLDTITEGLKRENDAANAVLDTLPGLVAEAAMLDDANASTAEGLLMVSAAFDEFTQAQKDTIDANGDGIATLSELEAALATFEGTAESTKEAIDGLAAGADEMAKIFAFTGEGADLAKNEALAYTEALIAGTIGAADYERLLQALVTGYGNTQEAALASAGATEESSAAMVEASLVAERAASALGDLASAAQTGFDAWVLGIRGMDGATEEATGNLDFFIEALDEVAGAAETGLRAWAGWQAAVGDVAETVAEATPAMEDAASALTSLNDAALAAGVAWRQLGQGPSMADQAAAIEEQAQAVADLSAQYIELQSAIATPAEALDNMFRVVVGNTDSIVSSLESVHTWIDNLVTVVDQTDVWGNWIGQWSELDSLLAQGEISIQDHAEALIAHDRIAAAHIDTQREVNALQAEYAPLIATSAERLADYVVELRGLSPELQLARLGFMDSALSAQAMQLQMFALSGASEEAMNNIIGGAARADPVLAAMLDQMGLIDIVEGGVVLTVDGLSELDAVVSALDRLTLTTWMATYGVDAATAEEELNRLFGTATDYDNSEFTAVATLDDGPAQDGFATAESAGHMWEASTWTGVADTDPTEAQAGFAEAESTGHMWQASTWTGTAAANNAPALSSIGTATSAMNTWGSKVGTGTANVNDNASGPISNAIGLLNAFDGRTATSYIYTIGVVSGSFGPTVAGHGGVIDGYADGGVVAKMGEWGPEMLHFPGGGVAMAQTPGLYTVPRGTYVDSAPATAAKLSGVGGINVHLNIGGNVYGIDDLTEQVTRQLVPAIQRASSSWLRGHGL